MPGLQDEVCNGIDDDCDGGIDEDEVWNELGDGCVVGEGVCAAVGILICNADDPTGPPVCSGTPGEGFEEVCNGLDDDCDGLVDEGDTWESLGTGCTNGDGICERGGVFVCDEADPAGPPVCSAEPGPSTDEVCNGLDDDCNGLIDDDPLWEDRGDVCVVGTGTCESAGILRCNPSDRRGPLVCSASPGEEGVEVCNGLDDDCDGTVDNLDSPLCPLQEGVCAGSRQICAGADGFLDCSTLNYGSDYEQNEISCDGLDNDCDGVVDDVDVDRDGFIAIECGGTDCDDFNPLAYPGALEVGGDAVDNPSLIHI